MSNIFITGATGLIGRMYIKHFLNRGDTVVYTSTAEDKINDIANEYTAEMQDKRLYGCCVDLMADDYMFVIRDFLRKHRLAPDYLINNARCLNNLKVDDWRSISQKKWMDEFKLDVIVPYQLAVEFVKSYPSMKGVVNIASMYGFLSYNDFLCSGSDTISINYGVSKAALLQLTRELAIRFAPDRVQVNAISYGGVAGRADDEFKKRYAVLCPWQDMLNEDDVVGHVMYLCSENSKGMTGHNLVVDGGFSVW